ncbi:MAG: hypothetical protein RL207_301 [Bacteroidota bacterium]|jgi:hypothetical protein
MYKFNVTYFETSKPTGKRSYTGIYNAYEDALFTSFGVLETIHLQATKGYHYDWMFLNHSVFVQRTNMNSMICEYDVQIYHPNNEGELKGKYKVEIECLNPPKSQEEQKELFRHFNEIGKKYKPSKQEKSKQHTTWLINEDRGIRWFIIQLHEARSLKKLKKEIPKATYYRNLKVCEEKGYIQNGKLVKRVFVTKYD